MFVDCTFYAYTYEGFPSRENVYFVWAGEFSDWFKTSSFSASLLIETTTLNVHGGLEVPLVRSNTIAQNGRFYHQGAVGEAVWEKYDANNDSKPCYAVCRSLEQFPTPSILHSLQYSAESSGFIPVQCAVYSVSRVLLNRGKKVCPTTYDLRFFAVCVLSSNTITLPSSCNFLYVCVTERSRPLRTLTWRERSWGSYWKEAGRGQGVETEAACSRAWAHTLQCQTCLLRRRGHFGYESAFVWEDREDRRLVHMYPCTRTCSLSRYGG